MLDEERFTATPKLRNLPEAKWAATNIYFAFRAKGEKEYRLTPLEQRYCYDYKLRMVLEFLKGAKSYQELDKDYTNSSLFDSADGFKECIEQVLGLEIEQ